MRLHSISSWMISLVLFMPLAACDDEDDSGDDSAGDSANDSGNGMTSSSEETCVTQHQCINDTCTCQTPGLEDQPCTDEEACVEECEICM